MILDEIHTRHHLNRVTQKENQRQRKLSERINQNQHLHNQHQYGSLQLVR